MNEQHPINFPGYFPGRVWRAVQRRVLSLLIVCGTAGLVAATGSQAETVNNEQLRDLIEGFGDTHNAAYFPALAPPPFGIPPGATAYSTNLSLKHLPPVLEAPADIVVMPNSADQCTYTFIHPRKPEEDRKDYLGLITRFPTEWGELGRPEVFHINTDVRVSVRRGGQPISGTVTLPSGHNGFSWRADTLITPLLDYPPWFLLGAKGTQDGARKGATVARNKEAQRKSLQLLREVLGNAAKEGATVAAGWFLLDGEPTPAGRPIRNEDSQRFSVIDVFPPTISTGTGRWHGPRRPREPTCSARAG